MDAFQYLNRRQVNRIVGYRRPLDSFAQVTRRVYNDVWYGLPALRMADRDPVRHTRAEVHQWCMARLGIVINPVEIESDYERREVV